MESKRKARGSSGGNDLPPAKRKTTNNSPAEAQRNEIVEIYTAYDALCTTATDNETHFATLLKAAEGSAAAQRLAATLLPKFAHHYPSRLNDTTSALMGLATLSLSDQMSIDTRRDAVASLTTLIKKGNASDIGGSDVVGECIKFALRNLRTTNSVNGWVETHDQDATITMTDGDNTSADTIRTALWTVCRESFTQHPRAVITTCLEILSVASSRDMHDVTVELFENHILAPNLPVSLVPSGGEQQWDFFSDDENEKKEDGIMGLLCNTAFSKCSEEDRMSLVAELETYIKDTSKLQASQAIPLLEQLFSHLKPTTATVEPTSKQLDNNNNKQASGRIRRQWSPLDNDDDNTNINTGTDNDTTVRLPRDNDAEPDEKQRQQQLPGGFGASQNPPPWPPPQHELDEEKKRLREHRSDLYRAPPSPESSKEEGEMELDEGELPPEKPVAQITSPHKSTSNNKLPTPGGAICLAAPCLHISGLPRGHTQSDVASDCGRYGRVVQVVLPSTTRLGSDEALVSCESLRDAVRIYEGLTTDPGLKLSSQVRFCDRDVVNDSPTTTHVWVAHQAGSGSEPDILRRLKRGNCPAPELILRVSGGRPPGLLLSFTTPVAANTAVKALEEFPPSPDVDLTIPPLDVVATTPGGGQQQQRDKSPRSAARRDHRSGRDATIPEYATCTLWVGHVPKGSAAEDEVLAAFQRYGELNSHRFMRTTACAFMDYRHVEDATEARFGLDGMRVAGSELKVQFKNENQYWIRHGGGRGGGRGRGGRGGSPPPYGRGRGRGRYGRGRSPSPDGYGYRRRSRSRSRTPPHYRDTYRGGGHRSSPPPSYDRRGRDDWRPGGGMRRSPSYDRGGRSRSRSPYPPPQHHREPPPPSRGNTNTNQWKGLLAKNTAVQGSVVCVDITDSGRKHGSWADFEPQGWPEILDVQQRTDIDYLVGTLYPATAASNKAIRCIVSSDSSSTGVGSFVSYLRGKNRAGVVSIPGMGSSVPDRLVYLIPPSEAVCSKLGVQWSVVGEMKECLIALIVPSTVK